MNPDLVNFIMNYQMPSGHEQDLAKARAIYKTLSPRAIKDSLQAAYENGLLRKEQLEHGSIYLGHCRNAKIAVWDAEAGNFIHRREKFGEIYPETIPATEDDLGFDVFVAVKKVGSNG